MKPTFKSTILLTEEGTGRVLISAPFTVVPDGTPIPKPRLFMFTRTHYACLIRQWRNDPDTPRNERNHPTPNRITLGLVTRGLKKLKEEATA